MRKKRLIFLLAITMVLVVVLSACSSKEGSDKASSASDTGETTISLWVLNDQAAYLKPILESFQKDNPTIHVEATYYGTDPLKESLKVAASSKTLPTMWFTWGGSLGAFYPENGLTMDLTETAASHKWSDIYNSAALDMVKYDNKTSGIPFHVASLGMFYPKELYTKLNLNPPTSFAEFEQQMGKIKESGITPLAVGGKGGWDVMRLTEQLLEYFAGPELHDKLNALEASWADPAVEKSFEKLKEWSDKNYFEKGFITLDPLEAETPLYQKERAYALTGPWIDTNISGAGNAPDSFGVFKFPNDQPKVRMSSFTEMFQISGSADGKEQEAAVKLGEYITGPDIVNKYIDQYGAPALKEFTFSKQSPHTSEMAGMIGDGSFLISDQALPQAVVQKLFEAQDAVVLGEWTPAQAGQEIQKAVETYKSGN
ncbi:ABC transporter substrate-binding protein [Paenibacillus sp. P3E]|uniref:ABC transporter substrate-binding protein n=1 Tax=Paenibacillus sp. P3E TaxID=1349435 RepID=UPI00093CCBF8|nr:extracellular solute-binding protein [Paenibacillus sp. P3E]OKP70360.1 ABC transporter substrate-binding protein [Paenibacillus sp. P3E]